MFPHGMDFRGRHKAAIGLKSDYMWRWGLSPLPPMTDLDSTRLLVYSSTCQLKKTNILVNSSTCQLVNLKKLFFFFYPHTLTFRLKRPVYRGFSGEGKCEGKCFTLTLLSHLPSQPRTPTLPARKHPACRGFYGWASDSIGRAQKRLLFTGSIAMLHLWCQNALLFWHCQDCWYSYAGLLV